MFVSGGVYKHGSDWGCNTWSERQSWQWQPSLTAHDPSPPIILEDAAAAGNAVGIGLVDSFLLSRRSLV